MNRSREAIRSIVHKLYSFFVPVYDEHNDGRSEGFFILHCHILRNTGDKGWDKGILLTILRRS